MLFARVFFELNGKIKIKNLENGNKIIQFLVKCHLNVKDCQAVVHDNVITAL